MPLNENDFGAYLPTTDIIDPANIYAMDLKGPELANLLARLYQTINNISMMVNLKDTGYYDLTEFVCGQLYFPDPTLTALTNQQPIYRNVYRKIINFGALANAAAKSVAHGIAPDAGFKFTRIYACSSDPAGLIYIPIPYASPVDADNIEMSVDVTNIIITTGSDRTAFTNTFAILEYIKV